MSKVLVFLILCIGFIKSINCSDITTENPKIPVMDPDKVNKENELEASSSNIIVPVQSTQQATVLTYAKFYPHQHVKPRHTGPLSTIALPQPQYQYVNVVPGISRIGPPTPTTFTFPTYHLGYHSFFGRSYNYANFGYTGIYSSNNGLPLYNGFGPLGLYTRGGNEFI